MYKRERPITSPQAGQIRVAAGGANRPFINLCANNYLGLADHPEIISRRQSDHGRNTDTAWLPSALSAARSTCTDNWNKSLADFLGMDDAILYAAAFDANGGVFEPLLSAEDAILSDSLNHASIIDGIRLCKAQRYRYANNNMTDLEAKLNEAAVGFAAALSSSQRMASSRWTGPWPTSRNCAGWRTNTMRCCWWMTAMPPASSVRKAAEPPSIFNSRADIITGTLGKSLGGAAGGFVAAAQPVIDMLRQRSRPYLFSNALPPMLVGGAIKALALDAQAGDELRERHCAPMLRYFRRGLSQAGFPSCCDGEHPIIPVMLGHAQLAQDFAQRLHELGIFVSGFLLPGRAKGPSPHPRPNVRGFVNRATGSGRIAAFTQAGRELAVITLARTLPLGA